VKELYHPQKQRTPEELPVLLNAREARAHEPIFLELLEAERPRLYGLRASDGFIKDELDKAFEEMQGVLVYSMGSHFPVNALGLDLDENIIKVRLRPLTNLPRRTKDV
jgi:hypothetical protein